MAVTQLQTFLWAALMLACAAPAWANPVEQACRQANRDAATPELCACIGAAADLSLSPRDQNQAASFFANPQAAQDIRRSDRRRDEAFWDRYQAFIATAEDICAGGEAG